MTKIIEISKQDGQKLLINTAYIVRITDDQKYGAVLIYNNCGQKEEFITDLNYQELKKLIQD